MLRVLILSLMSIFPFIAWAEGNLEEPPAVPESPELPPRVQSGEEMEPDITIIRRGKDTVQEYRRNGQLYMVKVIPQVGPPYYFLDLNGDGKMDVKKSDFDNYTNINLWTLFEWD